MNNPIGIINLLRYFIKIFIKLMLTTMLIFIMFYIIIYIISFIYLRCVSYINLNLIYISCNVPYFLQRNRF